MAQVRLELMAGVMSQTQQLLLEDSPVPVDETALLAKAQERSCNGCPCRKGCRDRLTPLPENLLLTVAAAIYDPVTTTDELIPSGETSSYRSNPIRLSDFALSRKDPMYVPRAKEIKALEQLRRQNAADPAVAAVMEGFDPAVTGLGSLVMALKPGDGSAREQAASCQRVLGGCANIAAEYATKRYRSNVVNWGMLPFVAAGLEDLSLQPGDKVYIPGIRALLEGDGDSVEATVLRDSGNTTVTLTLPGLTREERDIILAGCLINYYAE